MTKVWPLQFRRLPDSKFIFTNDAGGYFKSSHNFLRRYIHSQLTTSDKTFLDKGGFSFDEVGDYKFTGYATRWAQRINPASELTYLILVPTLRCNLMCDYCQVSRAAEHAKGFDWDDERVDQVLSFLDGMVTTKIKIEFQGGEPLLRIDILKKIRDFCRLRFDNSEFVICTNLQRVSDEAWDFLNASDTSISTSFDGTALHHVKRRTKTAGAHGEFVKNLDKAISDIGRERVSALPTIDPQDPPSPKDLLHEYTSWGFTSIFLRRVNYQGFARKKYEFEKSSELWGKYYRSFIDELISYNEYAQDPVEEYYLSHLLRSIVGRNLANHVDLRNPNWLGMDYLVVDFDGNFYPTDEARMVTRVGKIDLSIGNIQYGIDEKKKAILNQEVSNLDDPDCMHCAYKPYCGLDIVDDLSRYGRIDLPRHKTAHCQSHLQLFDLAFELLYSESPQVQKSLSYWLGVERFHPFLVKELK